MRSKLLLCVLALFAATALSYGQSVKNPSHNRGFAGNVELPTMRRISASQHRGILDALRERDAQRAKTLMREHWLTSMNGSLKDTMESLRQAKASGPDETES